MSERIAGVHDGVETRQRPGTAIRPRVRLISVGRIAAPKDFRTLIQAAADLDPTLAELVVLGEGPDRPIIEAEIARLGVGDRITLAGEVDDVPSHLRAADVFVLSSNSEGLPISVLEAMAAGLPIVASDVDGLSELVEHGLNGTLVHPQSPGELAAALVALVRDPGERRRMGKASRQRAVDDFSIDACRSAHLALYRYLLGSRK